VKNNAIIASKIADGAVTTNKIADDAVTGAKLKESTLSQVPSANTANTATSATTASSATSSNPTAFAKVNTDGSVDGALSKGLTSANVTNPAAGVYCLTVPAFTPRGGQVTPQFGGSNGTTANITIGGTGNCPAPAVQVLTFSGGAAPAFSNLTFYVELYH
jgi:trimeric autotransporter adhesin